MQKLNSRELGGEDLVGEITDRSMEDEWIAGDVEKKENTRSGVLKKGCVSNGCKECFVHRFRIRSESRKVLMSI